MSYVSCCVLLVATMTALVSGADSVIKCYSCSGVSGAESNSYPSCGLPFSDNTDFTSSNRLPTVSCEGVCVTNVVFSAAAVPSTRIYRSCSDAPVKSGCEYQVSTNGLQQWSCIKTCSTDNCNTGSDGTQLAPSSVVQLLLLSVTAFVGLNSLL
jgi:hypothetical protein